MACMRILPKKHGILINNNQDTMLFPNNWYTVYMVIIDLNYMSNRE